MSRRISVKTLLSAITLALPLGTTMADCPLENARYEDAGGKGFRLEFGPSSGATATEILTAAINHPQRGAIFRFSLNASMGTGQLLLHQRDAKGESAWYRIHFFQDNLRSWTFEDSDTAAPYAFVEGLGYADYYGKNPEESRRLPIGNPIWKLLPCSGVRIIDGTTPERTTEKNRNGPSPESSDVVEWTADDGLTASMGVITDLGTRGGDNYLLIDYVKQISEDECRKRVEVGALGWEEVECDVNGLRFANDNAQVREFYVSERVEVIIERPSRPAKTMSWDELTRVWRERSNKTTELWKGLWRIYRREDAMEDVIERIEWFYMP